MPFPLSPSTPPPLIQPLASEPSGSSLSNPERLAPPTVAPVELTAPGLSEPESSLETIADRQEYDSLRQVFTAVGNVVLQFRQAQLTADQLQTDLVNRIVVAEGNVTLTRGGQILRGERLEYNLILDRGSLTRASGDINLPTVERDFADPLPTDVTAVPLQPLPDQLSQQQPTQLTIAPGVERIRFEADRLDFEVDRWQATNIRITNDPFSPPELEFRAALAIYERISEFEDRVTARRGRLVFDQTVSLPLLRQQVTFSQRRRNILPFDFGVDSDRGGLFIGRSFEVVNKPQTSLVVTPQFFLERAISGDPGTTAADLFGGTIQVSSVVSPRTTAAGFISLTSLEPDDFKETARANFRLQQAFGNYRLSLDASLRDRLFNGSLGEQDVRSSLGAVFFSPSIPLGKTGFNFSYQIGSQYITADTDRSDLTNLATLGRFQGSVSLGRSFDLWRGSVLPATATQGMRYTPVPVQPYLQLYTGVLGVSSGYSNGDTQQILTGTLGLQGQFGNFSRRFGDYTGFNLSYTQRGNFGTSPFIFDRIVDYKVLSLGIMQQIYGPLRAGLQASVNLDTGRAFNTDIILEYSRRTYGVILRYSPDRQLGALLLRISSFNWRGNTDPFSQPDIGNVEGGVIRPGE